LCHLLYLYITHEALLTFFVLSCTTSNENWGQIGLGGCALQLARALSVEEPILAIVHSCPHSNEAQLDAWPGPDLV